MKIECNDTNQTPVKNQIKSHKKLNKCNESFIDWGVKQIAFNGL